MRHAGLDMGDKILTVDLQHFVHPGHDEGDTAVEVFGIGDRTADADFQLLLISQFHDFADLGGLAGKHHGQRLAGAFQVPGHGRRRIDDVLTADDCS